jgi:Acetyltransferase (GNAT) domain
MQTHAWSSARVGLVSNSPLHLFGVEEGGNLQAVAPLIRIGHWLRELPAMFEPSDLAWRSHEALQTLADALAGQPVPLYLDRLPEQSPTIEVLRHAYAHRGLVLTKPAMPTPFIDLEGCREIDATFTARRRSDFRRAERKAAERGTIAYVIHSPTSDAEVRDLLSDAYAVEAQSWKAATGTALTTDVRQGNFFNHFTRAAARDGSLRIAFLRLDGRPIAMQIASEWQQRFWLFKISHDQAFDHCSPGQLLLRHTLRYAAACGLRSYEFMGIMDNWTRRWATDSRRYLQVRAIPFTTVSAKMLTRRTARIVYDRVMRLVR